MCGSSSTTQTDTSNSDFPQAAGIQKEVALALGAAQYLAYNEMVKKQEAIALQIQKRADEIHAAWSGIYLPRESEIVNEIYSQSEYTPQTELRSLEAQAEVARQFAIAKKNALYCLSVSCEGAVCDTERKLSIAEARAKAWQIQSAVRQEEAKADVKNAQIRSDKVQVLNLGRGHAAAAGTLLQAASNIYESVGAQSAAANNALANTIGGAFRQLTGSGAGAQAQRSGAFQPRTNYDLTSGTNANTGWLGLRFNGANSGGFGSNFSLGLNTAFAGTPAAGVGAGYATLTNGAANGSSLTTQPSLGDVSTGGQ